MPAHALRPRSGTAVALGSSMVTVTPAPQSHDLAIVRTLQAMLEEALHRSDYIVARDLAEQIEHEIRRQGARCSRR